MTQEKIEYFKQELLKEKQEIINSLKKFAVEDTDDKDFNSKRPQYGNSDDDFVQETNDHLTNVTMEHILEDKLKEIDQALEKIENNTYGICEKCNKEIEEKKLEINPSTDYCIKCTKEAN